MTRRIDLNWTLLSAKKSLLGRTRQAGVVSCLSMLSASLQLYFNTWERNLGLSCGKSFKAEFSDGGLVGGYRAGQASCAGVD